jgi:Zn-dependent peptidase ImmA (M78 family)/DNA-binding XRE family transcriptional regulator
VSGDAIKMKKQGKFNGERLKSARLYRGKTLTEIADATEISKQSLSLYENGKNIPEINKVLTLSQTLGFPYDFFFKNDTYQVKTETTYFRSLVSASKRDRTAQSVKMEYVAKIYEAILEYIDFPALNVPNFTFSGSDDHKVVESEKEVAELENLANQLREYWKIGNEPIDDIRYLLESNGLIITCFDTNVNNIDAFSQRTIINGEDVYIIAISKDGQTTARAMFDMAHELAHILLHPWSEDLELISKEEFKVRERQANIFAGAFLLPRDSFGKEISRYPNDLNYYIHLKEKWHTSIKSMVYRAHQLGHITPNQYQYMMRQMSKNGWRLSEPGDTAFVLENNIMQTAVDVMLEDKDTTTDDILYILEEKGVILYPEEIEEIIHLKQGTLKTIPKEGAKIIPLKRIDLEN